jgi:hypothetical protein
MEQVYTVAELNDFLNSYFIQSEVDTTIKPSLDIVMHVTDFKRVLFTVRWDGSIKKLTSCRLDDQG